MYSRKSISKMSRRPAVEFLVTDDELDRVSGGALGASARMVTTGGTSIPTTVSSVASTSVISGAHTASDGFAGASSGKQ